MFFTKGIALGGSNTSNDLGCTMQKIQLLSNPSPTPSKFPLSRFLTRTQIDLWFSTFSLGFPDSSVGKESACNAGDPGLIPGLGRSPEEGIGYPL